METIKNFVRENSKENSLPSLLLFFYGFFPLMAYFAYKYFLYQFHKKNPILFTSLCGLFIVICIIFEYIHLFHHKGKDYFIIKKRLLWTYYISDWLIGLSLGVVIYIFVKLDHSNYIAPAGFFICGIYCLILSFFLDRQLLVASLFLIILSPLVLIIFQNTLFPSLVIFFICTCIFILIKHYNLNRTIKKPINITNIKFDLFINSQYMVFPTMITFLGGIMVILAYFILTDKIIFIPLSIKVIIGIILILSGVFMEVILMLKRIKDKIAGLSWHIYLFTFLFEFLLLFTVSAVILIFNHLHAEQYILPFISHIVASILIIFSLSFLNDFIIYSVFLYLLSALSFFFLDVSVEINAFGFSLLMLLYSVLNFKKERQYLSENR